MESRFAHLRQRDTSVSMLRTKMSRRRSQSQKENRERTVNTRRQLQQLDQIPEKNPAQSKVDDRVKQLERWKERKALEKEKAKREKEGKGVFKTGLYHPKDTLEVVPLPDVPGASARAKGKKVDLSQSSRVTRSSRQQPLQMEDPNILRRAQPAVEKASRARAAPLKPKTNTSAAVPALSTRSARRPPARAAPPEKSKPAVQAAGPSGGRVTRSRAAGGPVAPSAGRGKNKETVRPAVVTDPVQREAVLSEEEEVPPPPPAGPQEEDMAVDPDPPADPAEPSLSSFAPEGFVFQAPVGLTAFKFEPMTPRSADAFLTPSPSFVLPPAPVFTDVPQAEPSPPPAPCSSEEPEHDVPYFRSEIARETERLTALSVHWESKVEDESIPEDTRDGMRTAVGQARLLMKERFGQFAGLVDDCELGRGDRTTTCSDLQGFWDMVHFQVEDVSRKFDALKEAEGRGWAEEHRPPPRQRKAVKKPSAAPAKPAGGRAAAAKSRLAAVKAAMRARQQAAEAEPAGKTGDEPEPSPEEAGPGPEGPAQDGGFVTVESPAKPPGPLRRSSRLSAAVLPQQSPCSTPSPRRVTRRSAALARTPGRVDAQTPAQLPLVLQQTPGPEAQVAPPQGEAGPGSLCFSPVSEAPSADTQPEAGPAGPETAAAPGLSTPKPTPPAITVVDAAVGPLRQSPVPAAENSSSAWSRPPSGTPTQPPLDSPAVSARRSPCPTPDELPGLDFERYLQPSLRGSLSPWAMDSPEMWSPTATDIEMESPRGQREEPTSEGTPEPSSVSSLQPPQVPTAEAAMLLFTPDTSDRIRQSVCPSDLMVFTPPI